MADSISNSEITRSGLHSSAAARWGFSQANQGTVFSCAVNARHYDYQMRVVGEHHKRNSPKRTMLLALEEN